MNQIKSNVKHGSWIVLGLFAGTLVGCQSSRPYTIEDVLKITDQHRLGVIAMYPLNSGDVRTVAFEKLTDQKALAKIAEEANPLLPNADGFPPRAVAKLTDQSLLAHLAVNESTHYQIRVAAIENLTDQSSLTRLAVNSDQKKEIRAAAIEKLADQALVTRFARDGEWWVRRAATRRLTDQTLLAEMAMNDKSSDVRAAATGQLADQKLLYKLAEDSSPAVRAAAARVLTDQVLLAKLAMDDKVVGVRLAAAGQVTNQRLLYDLAMKDQNYLWAAIPKITDETLLAEIARKRKSNLDAKEIGAWRDDSPSLALLAGDMTEVTQDGGELVARLKLAALDPRIRERIPELTVAADRKSFYLLYDHTVGGMVAPGGGAYTSGEHVWIAMKQGKGVIVDRQWSTIFPRSTSKAYDYIGAVVDGIDLMSATLCVKNFTQQDLAELCKCSIPEVRGGAAANLKDQLGLAKVALSDESSKVRQVAVKRLSDRAILEKIAATDRDGAVRKAALAALQK